MVKVLVKSCYNELLAIWTPVLTFSVTCYFSYDIKWCLILHVVTLLLFSVCTTCRTHNFALLPGKEQYYIVLYMY